ncbi:tripartite tricarboxylate transporter substrate binding protein [Polaromonas sp. P1-6]|nr:tripartite tricarboxylate transporter substrate binding protein [Polaromonas sp. P1-6]
MTGSTAALAQASYPNKPIRIVVGYPPGGGTDAAGRQMAQRIQDKLKATVIVENRPGASGGLGQLTVARSAPDGYSLAVGTVGSLAVKTTFPELKFDPVKELVPVALLSSTPHALVVPASSPYTTVAQLVDAAKTKKDGLTYASGGVGGSTHLAVEMLAATGGFKAQHIAYKGSSPAHLDLVAGRVDFMMDILSSASPLIRSGRLRLLAVTSAKRVPQYPDVPTVSETSGFANFEAVGWLGLFAPRGTDPKIIQKLSNALNDKQDVEGFKAQVEANGAYYTPMPTGQFDVYVKSEYNRWYPVIERSLK